MSSNEPRRARLIIGDSETNADLYYATHFLVGGAVAYLELTGQRILMVNDLEYGRAGDEADVDELVSTTPYELALEEKGETPSITAVVDRFLRDRIGDDASALELVVPLSFALGYAESLAKLGYRVLTQPDPFFPERNVKTEAELAAIEEVQAHAESAMQLAVDILRESDIAGDRLRWRGVELTSELLRREIQRFLLDRDCDGSLIIVAGGDQGADPHHRGSGPLPAHQTIILDIFPHSTANRYWGDMTRTVVRGEASAAVKKLYADVFAAQELAISMLRHGVDGRAVHQAVVEKLKELGNENGEVSGKKTGFIHGTGHGLGLDIHELPRLGRLPSTLQAGEVVTVEPGLYYPGVGAVRLEDLLLVTHDGSRNLNRFPKELEV